MNAEDPELDLERDPLLRALAELPREDLDAWRSERLRTRAHAELSRAVTQQRGPHRLARAVEPLLLATCTMLALCRLAGVIALLLRAAP